MSSAPCRYCGKDPCDDDCEELAMIYRQQQREKLRDIDPEWADEYCRERGLGDEEIGP